MKSFLSFSQYSNKSIPPSDVRVEDVNVFHSSENSEVKKYRKFDDLNHRGKVFMSIEMNESDNILQRHSIFSMYIIHPDRSEQKIARGPLKSLVSHKPSYIMKDDMEIGIVGCVSLPIDSTSTTPNYHYLVLVNNVVLDLTQTNGITEVSYSDSRTSATVYPNAILTWISKDYSRILKDLVNSSVGKVNNMSNDCQTLAKCVIENVTCDLVTLDAQNSFAGLSLTPGPIFFPRAK